VIRHSGRVAGVIAGTLIALIAIPLTLISAAATLAPNLYFLPSPLRVGLVLEAAFFCVAAAFGCWLIVYLNLPGVKTWFDGTTYYIPSTVTQPSQPAIADSHTTIIHGYTPISARASTTDKDPRIARMLVSLFAILCLVGATIMPMYAKWGIPITYLGIRLQGHAAADFHIVFACVNITIAIGLLRRIPLAYVVALILEALGAINRLLLLVPSYRLRASAFYAAHYDPWRHYSPWSQILRSTISGTLFILFSSMSAFFLWALWRDLASIRATPLPVSTGTRMN
jgi:hypothetical protein